MPQEPTTSSGGESPLSTPPNNDNWDPLSHLQMEYCSESARKFERSIIEKDKARRKVEREIELAKKIDPETRPILLVKKGKVIETVPASMTRPGVQTPKLVKSIGKSRPIRNIDAELKKAEAEVPFDSKNFDSARSGRAAGYRLIEGVEFLPPGYLELDPLPLSELYLFDSHDARQCFREEQRKTSVTRRKQYDQKEKPRKRDVTILVKDSPEDKVETFVKTWIATKDRKMNKKEIEVASVLLEVSPEQLLSVYEREAGTKTLTKAFSSQEEAKEAIAGPESGTKAQKIIKNVKTLQSPNEYTPRYLAKYQKSLKSKTNFKEKDRFDNAKAYSTAEKKQKAAKAYDSIDPRLEKLNEKTGGIKPDFGSEILNKIEKAVDELKAPLKPASPLQQKNPIKGNRDQNNLKISEYDFNDVENEELRKYFSEQLASVIDRLRDIDDKDVLGEDDREIFSDKRTEIRKINLDFDQTLPKETENKFSELIEKARKRESDIIVIEYEHFDSERKASVPLAEIEDLKELDAQALESNHTSNALNDLESLATPACLQEPKRDSNEPQEPIDEPHADTQWKSSQVLSFTHVITDQKQSLVPTLEEDLVRGVSESLSRPFPEAKYSPRESEAISEVLKFASASAGKGSIVIETGDYWARRKSSAPVNIRPSMKSSNQKSPFDNLLKKALPYVKPIQENPPTLGYNLPNFGRMSGLSPLPAGILEISEHSIDEFEQSIIKLRIQAENSEIRASQDFAEHRYSSKGANSNFSSKQSMGSFKKGDPKGERVEKNKRKSDFPNIQLKQLKSKDPRKSM